MAMEEQNQDNRQEERKLTNAELELKADSQGPTEVKRISYWRLIGRRFMRQPSAVVGLIILIVMILIAIFGPFMCQYNYTEPDFTALNMAPNAKHWFGTDGGGFDLFACVVHGLGRSLTIGIIYSVLTTIIAAIVGTGIAYVRGIPEKICMWLLDMLMVIPSCSSQSSYVRLPAPKDGSS
jgi:peptide/nickel transport system permease protein